MKAPAPIVVACCLVAMALAGCGRRSTRMSTLIPRMPSVGVAAVDPPSQVDGDPFLAYQQERNPAGVGSASVSSTEYRREPQAAGLARVDFEAPLVSPTQLQPQHAAWSGEPSPATNDGWRPRR